MLTEGGLRSTGTLRESTANLPLVSILTVVFNAAKTLERTINSVIKQEYSNIEYIIIDGCSTDDSLTIINHHADKIDYFISEPDNGIYDAMNKGLKLCKGDIIGIINADDWYEQGAIGKVAQSHLKNKDCVQHGLLRLHDQQGEIEVRSFYSSRLPQHMIMHPTCFVPASIYKQHGYFDLQYKIAADYDLMLRFYTNGINFCFNHNVLANFSMGGACQSNDILSLKEVIKIRYMNGVITKSRYKKILLKTMITSQYRRIRNFIKSLLQSD